MNNCVEYLNNFSREKVYFDRLPEKVKITKSHIKNTVYMSFDTETTSVDAVSAELVGLSFSVNLIIKLDFRQLCKLIRNTGITILYCNTHVILLYKLVCGA